MKHTPGPWKVTCLIPESYRVFPEGDTQYQTKTPTEMFANARLIAAAPDLLDALKAALLEFDCECDEYSTPSEIYVQTINAMKSAISKAEGDNHG
jgi:hypothetical protein